MKINKIKTLPMWSVESNRVRRLVDQLNSSIPIVAWPALCELANLASISHNGHVPTLVVDEKVAQYIAGKLSGVPNRYLKIVGDRKNGYLVKLIDEACASNAACIGSGGYVIVSDDSPHLLDYYREAVKTTLMLFQQGGASPMFSPRFCSDEVRMFAASCTTEELEIVRADQAANRFKQDTLIKLADELLKPEVEDILSDIWLVQYPLPSNVASVLELVRRLSNCIAMHLAVRTVSGVDHHGLDYSQQRLVPAQANIYAADLSACMPHCYGLNLTREGKLCQPVSAYRVRRAAAPAGRGQPCVLQLSHNFSLYRTKGRFGDCGPVLHTAFMHYDHTGLTRVFDLKTLFKHKVVAQAGGAKIQRLVVPYAVTGTDKNAELLTYDKFNGVLQSLMGDDEIESPYVRSSEAFGWRCYLPRPVVSAGHQKDQRCLLSYVALRSRRLLPSDCSHILLEGRVRPSEEEMDAYVSEVMRIFSEYYVGGESDYPNMKAKLIHIHRTLRSKMGGIPTDLTPYDIFGADALISDRINAGKSVYPDGKKSFSKFIDAIMPVDHRVWKDDLSDIYERAAYLIEYLIPSDIAALPFKINDDEESTCAFDLSVDGTILPGCQLVQRVIKSGVNGIIHLSHAFICEDAYE